MKLVPDALGRALARQVLLAQKNAPSLLFGAGVVGMIGSTVLACRATLKMDEVIGRVEHDLNIARAIDYEDREFERKQDVAIAYFRGVANVTKVYAPSVLLGAASIGCLTKSHNLLQQRNLALTAAYAAVDEAFRKYRERVVEKYGVEEDRLLRHEYEEGELVDNETGKLTSIVRAAPGEPSGYARWFDSENSNWNEPPFEENNILFLRQNQNWANDFLKARGYIFLNEVYRMLGIEETSAGVVVGWVYDPRNLLGRRKDDDPSDNYVDFGCWTSDGAPIEFFNGREGSILLDFNVDGTIWELIDELNRRRNQ